LVAGAGEKLTDRAIALSTPEANVESCKQIGAVPDQWTDITSLSLTKVRKMSSLAFPFSNLSIAAGFAARQARPASARDHD